MPSYRLPLRHDRRVSYRRSLWLIVGLDLLYFLLQAYREPQEKPLTRAVLAVVLCLVPFIQQKVIKPAHRTAMDPAVMALGFLSGLHLFERHWWIGPILMMVVFLYVMAVRSPILALSDTGVRLEGFRTRSIGWEELSNLVLRDGLVTVDFRNNRLLQQELLPDSDPIDEAAFNRFCTERIASAHPSSITAS
ncbi:MAG: hypothetical protein RJA57_1666 [Bacteroidota bacterium]|jgi:hypothetical protein